MENYIGKVCPFCKTEIKEGDAVKVCPSCGIPHHEYCWEENKGCTTFGCSEQHYEEQHTNPTDVCVNCGAPLGDGQEFCPKCGTPKGGPKKRVCSKCGAELQNDQEFCPKCGTRYTEGANATNSAIEKFNESVKKENKKKKLIPVIVGAGIVIVGLILFFVLRGTPVSDVSFSKDAITVTEGETAKIVCTVSPDDATDKTLTWKSSNSGVATVDENGKVTAISEGTCTITATSSNGKSDECKVTVEKAGPDFKAIYEAIGGEYPWAEVGSDNSYLKLDTNPYDRDDDGLAYSEAYVAASAVNAVLGLPDSLTSAFGEVTGADGRQTKEYPSQGVSVSYKYHPDKGLEITYELIH